MSDASVAIEFSRRLRALMAYRKADPGKLRFDADIAEKRFDSIEAGRAVPTVSEAMRLANRLDARLTDLLGLTAFQAD